MGSDTAEKQVPSPGDQKCRRGLLTQPLPPQTLPWAEGGVSPFPLSPVPEWPHCPSKPWPASLWARALYRRGERGGGSSQGEGQVTHPLLPTGPTPTPSISHQTLNLHPGLDRSPTSEGRVKGGPPRPRFIHSLRVFRDFAPLCNLTTTL